MEIIPFKQYHARSVAEIHIEGQPGTFLTRLGPSFLTALYATMAESPWAFGSVVVDGETVAGVGIVALDMDRLFGDAKRRHWHRFVWPMLGQVIRHPSLLAEIVQSLRYSAKLDVLPGEMEILFMGLRRAYMRQGIGPRLLSQLLDEAHRRGCTLARATVDRRNRAMRWMVADLPGVYVDREIELHGRTMVVYRAELPLRDTSNQ
jgi:GNAT superfamily N-acetyltransferase